MSFRHSIQRNPVAAVVIAGVLIVVCVATLFYQVSGAGEARGPLDKVWYSIDDGTTWFADEPTKMPFKRDGKPAYRAHVVDDGLNKPFVAYLDRYSPLAERQIEALRGPDGVLPADKRDAYSMMASLGRLVKRPGLPESAWAEESSDAGIQMRSVPTRPGGSDMLKTINP